MKLACKMTVHMAIFLASLPCAAFHSLGTYFTIKAEYMRLVSLLLPSLAFTLITVIRSNLGAFLGFILLFISSRMAGQISVFSCAVSSVEVTSSCPSCGRNMVWRCSANLWAFYLLFQAFLFFIHSSYCPPHIWLTFCIIVQELHPLDQVL